MQLLGFMERRLSDFEKRGDRERAGKLRKVIREYRAMLDAEQTALPII